MDLAEAERAAVAGGSGAPSSGKRVANVDQPRDPVAEFEFKVASQFAALREAAQKAGCLLNARILPRHSFGRAGMEHEVWHDQSGRRYWKTPQHGGAHLIKRAKVQEWGRRIDEPFTTESMWGFKPWPEQTKKEWRVGCRQTIQKLLDVLED
jgi:hypothetical protein